MFYVSPRGEVSLIPEFEYFITGANLIVEVLPGNVTLTEILSMAQIVQSVERKKALKTIIYSISCTVAISAILEALRREEKMIITKKGEDATVEFVERVMKEYANTALADVAEEVLARVVNRRLSL